MFLDICFPNKNENKFIEISKLLGIDLCFCYSEPKKVKASKEKNQKAILFVKDRKGTKSEKYISNQNHRSLFSKCSLFFDFETIENNDSFHFKKAGINQVNAKMIKAYGISHSMILSAKDRPKIIGRAKQNIKLIQKFDVVPVVASFSKDPFGLRKPAELFSMLCLLGMRQNFAKAAINNFSFIYRA